MKNKLRYTAFSLSSGAPIFQHTSLAHLDMMLEAEGHKEYEIFDWEESETIKVASSDKQITERIHRDKLV